MNFHHYENEKISTKAQDINKFVNDITGVITMCHNARLGLKLVY